jgi:hypothetical protein
MRHLMALLSRPSVFVLRRTALQVGLSFCVVCSVLADDIAVSEQSFDCILDWPKVRNTHINNADPAKLKEAMRIFRDSLRNSEYPVGTILQLLPYEAMVKHPRGTFPKTNGWECFSLDVSATLHRGGHRLATLAFAAGRIPSGSDMLSLTGCECL